jgi:hypothetical protein
VPVIAIQREKCCADDVDAFTHFQKVECRQCRGLIVRIQVDILAQVAAEIVPHAVASDAEEPVPEAAALDVKAVKSLDRQEPDLLAHIFSRTSVSAHEVVDQPEEVVDVSIVHGGPR